MTMLMEALSFTFIQPGWYEWEYVWGPDYVDELAFVVNANVDVRYALQDANYNLVAWLKPAGAILSPVHLRPPTAIFLRAADVSAQPQSPADGHSATRACSVRPPHFPGNPPPTVPLSIAITRNSLSLILHY